uniref:Uncharacterized protein n=1 Tax=Glossina austeni TaxID=7395 RepID=A0A1A9V709_GLOAU
MLKGHITHMCAKNTTAIAENLAGIDEIYNASFLVSAMIVPFTCIQFTCKLVQHENTDVTCPLYEKGTVNFESYEQCMDNTDEDGCDMVILIHKLVHLICDVHKYCQTKSPDTKLDFFEEFLHFLVNEKLDPTTEM